MARICALHSFIRWKQRQHALIVAPPTNACCYYKGCCCRCCCYCCNYNASLIRNKIYFIYMTRINSPLDREREPTTAPLIERAANNPRIAPELMRCKRNRGICAPNADAFMECAPTGRSCHAVAMAMAQLPTANLDSEKIDSYCGLSAPPMCNL